MMDLNDFVLERSIFQFRYSPSYLLWDNAGVLWNDAQIKWPKLKIKRGEPNVTAFTLDNKYDIAVAPESASVVCHFPSSDLADFIDKAAYFVGATTARLVIHEYSRVGLRLLYRRTYADKESATSGLLESKLLNLSEGPHFGIKGFFSFPEFAIRWEGESVGVALRLRAEGRKIDFDPPMEAPELQPIHEEKFGLLYDIDYFTNGTLTVGQFRTQDWIKNALHLVRRDSRKFLGG